MGILTDFQPGGRCLAGYFHRRKPLLQPVKGQPAAKFEAAVRKNRQGFIAQSTVEGQGGGIFPGHQSVQKLEALVFENRLQRPVKRPADAPAPGLGAQVYGRLGAPIIGRPGKGGAGVGIAQNLPRLLVNQPGKPGGNPPEPVPKLLPGGHGVFKGRGGGKHIGAVDIQNFRNIRFCRNAEHGKASLAVRYKIRDIR